ncbi:hypothetical protein ABIB57_002093 [Devosia sp. UYZn731]
MDEVARLPLTDRAALFGETGAGRGVANTIIEKDLWVCWNLKRLFDLPQAAAASLVFKGGTSLSKAFGINFLFEGHRCGMLWPGIAAPDCTIRHGAAVGDALGGTI